MASIPVQESGDSGISLFCESYQGVSTSEEWSAMTDLPKNRSYKMNHKKRGPLIIINNHKFNGLLGQKDRKGSDVDSQNLKKVFEDLRFEVTIYQNQTVSQMQEIVKMASKADYSACDCFAMAILSHGDIGNTIYGTDGTIKFELLIDPISKNKVKSLIGKPKLFFIQACRGDEIDDGVKSEEMDGQYEEDAKTIEEENNLTKIPVEADFLYSYSTAPGYFSFRNKRYGSWYIQALKNVFEEYAQEHDLLHLLTLVSYEVAVKKASKSESKALDNKKQVPSFVSMLTKLLKFH